MPLCGPCVFQSKSHIYSMHTTLSQEAKHAFILDIITNVHIKQIILPYLGDPLSALYSHHQAQQQYQEALLHP